MLTQAREDYGKNGAVYSDAAPAESAQAAVESDIATVESDPDQLSSQSVEPANAFKALKDALAANPNASAQHDSRQLVPPKREMQTLQSSAPEHFDDVTAKARTYVDKANALAEKAKAPNEERH